MGLKAGPYENAKAAKTALVEAGYLDVTMPGRRPDKWKHRYGTKKATFAILYLDKSGTRCKIVPYPDLRRLDYRITSDAERSGQGFRLDLRPRSAGRPRTRVPPRSRA